MKKKLWLQFGLAIIALILFLFTYNYKIFDKKKINLSENLDVNKNQEIELKILEAPFIVSALNKTKDKVTDKNVIT